MLDDSNPGDCRLTRIDPRINRKIVSNGPEQPQDAETLLRYAEQRRGVDGHDDINGENRTYGMTLAFD